MMSYLPERWYLPFLTNILVLFVSWCYVVRQYHVYAAEGVRYTAGLWVCAVATLFLSAFWVVIFTVAKQKYQEACKAAKTEAVSENNQTEGTPSKEE